MKIAFIIPELNFSGAPKMITWVANQMRERQYEVEMIALYSATLNQPLRPDIQFHSLDLTLSKSRVARNTIDLLQGIRKLHNYLTKSKPDVIVMFISSLGYVYLPINRFFARGKIIVSERVDPNQRKGLLAKFQTWLLGFADAYVFQTEGAMKCFSGRIKNRSFVIPNPVVRKSNIAMNEVCCWEERDNRIVMVGRLELKQKRQDVLIKAIKNVHLKHPEIIVEIFGEGDDKDRIAELIEHSQLNDVIRLVGCSDNVEKDIYHAKVFALTSDYEGIPNALIEAMSVGLPCVTTDCSPGGARLLISNLENGLIVNCGDEVALSEAICYLLEHPEESQRMGCEAQKSLERFNPDSIAGKWESAIISVSTK